MGALLFGLVLVANFAALSAARRLVSRAFGIEGLTWGLGGSPQPPEKVRPAAQIAVVLTAAAATYLIAVSLFFYAYLLGGELVANSTRVGVVAGLSAAGAGIQDGDRVMAVAGVEVATWRELADTVQAHPGERIEVNLIRDGQKLVLPVTPGAKGTPNEGRIGIYMLTDRRQLSAAEALALSVFGPLATLREIARGAMQTTPGKLESPAAMVSQRGAGEPGRQSDAVLFLAHYDSYLWLGFVALAIASAPRKRQNTPSPPPAK